MGCNIKLGFLFSFFGIIDLVAILPFYLAAGIVVRSGGFTALS